MTIKLDISTESQEGLLAQAHQHGMSLAACAQSVLNKKGRERQLATVVPDAKMRPIWDVIADIMRDLPDEAFGSLPTDSASEHDHYIYGTAKRNA